ncbi:hypothetical protein FACS1894201_11130 [Bacteroidia bacterium]|nr:hypothetical protein FACS1894201_11130 [Bacteroidia bacterium]
MDLGIASPLADFMPISDSFKEYALKMGEQKSIYSFLVLVVFAPFFEEFIFRGIMLDGLLKRYSPLTAILLSSFLFGLVHLNMPQLVGGMVMGCFIGWVYYKSQSLTLSMIIHATTNFGAFLSRFLFSAEVQVKSSLEVYGGWQNLTLIMIASGIIVFCSVCIIRKVYAPSSVNTATTDNV